MTTVAITGASGLLGGNLAAELAAEGHRVVAMRRAGTCADHLADVAIEWRDAELGDPAALARAFDGAEAVFHCAAAVMIKRRVTPEMTAANVDGTAHVIDACVAAGVARLVHVSSVVAVGLSEDGRPVDETAPWNFDAHGMVDAYAITKHRAEEVVAGARERLDCVIVNPTYMLGPRDARPSSGKLILDVARRRVPGWTPGINNFVDVRDVARGMIAAWRRGRRGERYILAGEEMTYRALPGDRWLRAEGARRRARPASRRRGSARRARSPACSARGATSSSGSAATRSSTRRRSATPTPTASGSRPTRPRASSAMPPGPSTAPSATRSRGSARTGCCRAPRGALRS
jgi:dihydroflavonol-4-reductase